MVGGFHHETNTFAPRKTTLDDFLHSASYPHMPRGADLPKAVKGQNLPIAGFIEQALLDEKRLDGFGTKRLGGVVAHATSR